MLTIEIPAFTDGDWIPRQFTQAAPGAAPGEGTSPEIRWHGAPEGTKSFFLHVHDPDFVRGNSIDDQPHWLVWNIPPTSSGIAEGQPRGARLPDGSLQISATGLVYRGPGAPASGHPHHYLFELHALDSTIDVVASDDAFETRRRLLQAVDGHVLARVVYTGVFKRPE